MPESKELALARDEQVRNRTLLKEAQVESDRLRVELRDARGQIEYWRTLAEYRKAVLDAQGDSTDRRPGSQSISHPTEPPSRRRRRLA